MSFDFEGAAVRVVKIGGEPWFVAADVCKALGIQNVTQAVARLDDDERAMLNIGLSAGAMNCINEPGIYELVLASRKPEAKRFKKWVTGTVLPAIRKDGAYIMGEEKVASGEMRPTSRSGRPAERRRGTAGAAHRYAGRSRHGGTSETAGPPFHGRHTHRRPKPPPLLACRLPYGPQEPMKRPKAPTQCRQGQNGVAWLY